MTAQVITGRTKGWRAVIALGLAVVMLFGIGMSPAQAGEIILSCTQHLATPYFQFYLPFDNQATAFAYSLDNGATWTVTAWYYSGLLADGTSGILKWTGTGWERKYDFPDLSFPQRGGQHVVGAAVSFNLYTGYATDWFPLGSCTTSTLIEGGLVITGN